MIKLTSTTVQNGTISIHQTWYDTKYRTFQTPRGLVGTVQSGYFSEEVPKWIVIA